MSRSTLLSAIIILFLVPWSAATSAPREPLPPATAELLVELVRVAAEYDLYSARCRGDISGRRTDNLKKVLIRRYGLTPTQVQDDYFPERFHRDARRNIEKEFAGMLTQLGGCRKAKKAGFQDELRVRYLELMDKLRRLP